MGWDLVLAGMVMVMVVAVAYLLDSILHFISDARRERERNV